LDHSTIKNNEFRKSAIFLESISCPIVVVLNSKIISNIEEKGAVFHKKCENKNYAKTTESQFNNTIFENNVSRDYGGIIFYDNLSPSDFFYNCTFYNNTAPIGT